MRWNLLRDQVHHIATEKSKQKKERERELKIEDHGRRTRQIESSSRQFSSFTQLARKEALGVAQELEK
jgi:hypothetical protein